MSDIVPLMSEVGVDIEMGERRRALYPFPMDSFMNIEGLDCVAIVPKNQTRRRSSGALSIPLNQAIGEVYKYLSLQDRVAFANTCRFFYDLAQSIPNQKYEMRIWTLEALDEFKSRLSEIPQDQVLPLRAFEIRAPAHISLSMIQRTMSLLAVLTLQFDNYKISHFKEYVQQPGFKELNFVWFYKYPICRYFYHYRFVSVDYMSCCSKEDMRVSNMKKLARHARKYNVTVTALGSRLVEVDRQWRVPYYFCKMLLILSPLSLGVGVILLIIANSLYETMSTTTREDGEKIYRQVVVDKDAYMWSEYLLEIAPYLFYIFGISAPFVLFYQCISRFCCRSWPHYEVLEDV